MGSATEVGMVDPCWPSHSTINVFGYFQNSLILIWFSCFITHNSHLIDYEVITQENVKKCKNVGNSI